MENKFKKLKVGDKVVCIQEWTYSYHPITPKKRYSIHAIDNNDFTVETDIKGDFLTIRIVRDLGARFEFGMYFDIIPLKKIRKEKLEKLNVLQSIIQ